MSVPTKALATYTIWLARIFAAVCLIASIDYFAFNKASGAKDAAVALLVAAVLVGAGSLSVGRTSSWLTAALITLGALAGGVLLVWTLLVPIAALALIVLFVRDALRSAPAAAEAPAAGTLTDKQ